MAEISVPAWPIPIHQTKLMIANAQPTGMLMPQMPVPFTNRYDTAIIRIMTNMNAMPAVTYHDFGVYFVSTRSTSLSVSDLDVYPGPMTGAGIRISPSWYSVR